MAKSKFITIEVNPVCHSSEVDNGDNLFLWTEIPNAIPRGNGTINIPMFSFPTQAQIDAGNAVPGSIYVMGVATATKTYSVNGLKFYFTFEIA